MTASALLREDTCGGDSGSTIYNMICSSSSDNAERNLYPVKRDPSDSSG